MALEKLERHKSPGIDEMPAELIKAGDITIRSDSINLLIPFIAVVFQVCCRICH
jgi:hypothetical protein